MLKEIESIVSDFKYELSKKFDLLKKELSDSVFELIEENEELKLENENLKEKLEKDVQ